MGLVRNYLFLSVVPPPFFFLDKPFVGFEFMLSLPVSQMFMTLCLAMCPFISRLLLGLNVSSILYIGFEQLYAKCQVLCTHDLWSIKSCLRMTEETFWRNVISAELINHFKAQGWIWVSTSVAGPSWNLLRPKSFLTTSCGNSKFQMLRVTRWHLVTACCANIYL